MSGHSHEEDFSVARSISDNKNIGINYVGGSVGTYTGRNPSFAVIELDAEFMIPLNFKTYYLDLVKAN